MEITKDLFRLEGEVCRSDSGYLFNWKIPSTLPYFDGHFPTGAILPGICIVDISRILIEEINKRRLMITQIKSGKFLDILVPGDEIKIELIKKCEEKWVVNWFKEEKKVSELKIEVTDYSTTCPTIS